MKFLSTLLSVLFVLFISVQTSAQSNKPVGQPVTEVTSSPVPDAQISEIVRKIADARNNGDVNSKLFWEAKLNEITKPQIINGSENQFSFKKEMKEIPSNATGLNVYLVSSGAVIANSISRDRVSGDLYAAVGCLNLLGSDTLKILRSTNNGASFTLLTSIWQGNLKINYNSIDVEAVSNGDSSFAFVSMSYIISSTYYSSVLRVRQDAGQIASVILVGNATNKYVFPRITSDNSKYTNLSFIYFSATLDSNSGSGRKLLSKLYRINSPFLYSLSLTSCYQNSGTNAYAYGVGGTAPDSATFESDIAYVNAVGDTDEVYTVTVVRGTVSSFGNGTGLYYTKSKDYGTTAPTLFNTQDAPFLKESPRIASTGYFDNSVMVIVKRLYAGGDWDPYFFKSNNINAQTPAFTGGFVNSSTDTTISVSVAGRPRSFGSYLFGYANRINTTSQGNVFIAQYSIGLINSVQVNPPGIVAYSAVGSPNVSFRNVNNDSCLVIWGAGNGGSYTTGGCSGPFIGVNNNSSVVDGFQLNQNYPNPFNPGTNISFTLPSKAFVNVTIYDVLGNKVTSLVNENKSEGYYNYVFDAKSLASGVYYYKVTFTTSDSKSFAQTRKMILMK